MRKACVRTGNTRMGGVTHPGVVMKGFLEEVLEV